MIYLDKPVDGTLVKKENRFRARVTVDGAEATAHIPNSGRLAELMIPGNAVLLERAANPERKTPYSLRSVRHEGRWVCIDSTVPNRLAAHWAETNALDLFAGVTAVRPEFTLGRHRYDLRCERDGKRPLLVEVKSVTLVLDGVARFPDAPTERGRSHLRHLAALHGGDYDAAVLFIVQRSDAVRFTPNVATDPDFGVALREAVTAGLDVRALRCRVDRRSITLLGEVPVESPE